MDNQSQCAVLKNVNPISDTFQQMKITEKYQGAYEGIPYSRSHTFKRILSAPPLQKVEKIILPRESLSLGHSELLARKSVAEGQVEVHYVYLKSANFPHFAYILSLARDCESRVRRVWKSPKDDILLHDEVLIRISYVGKMNDNIPIQETLKNGKTIVSSEQEIWMTTPLICFQNDLPLDVAIQLLQSVVACPKILIKNDSIAEDIDVKEGNIRIVDQENFLEEITYWLEKPLYHLLKTWIEGIKTVSRTNENQWVMEEVETILEEMLLKENSTRSKLDGSLHVVPDDVKQCLFGMDDVNSFGTWYNFEFKVFVTKNANKRKLHEKLNRLNPEFFQKYNLRIETRKIVVKPAMRQGDDILPQPPNETGKFRAGTLGGFVTKTKDPQQKYALTCGHIFPMINLPAFADSSLEFREIGTSIFTKREIYCDMAAIKINEYASSYCDTTFTNEKRQNTNAFVYDRSIADLNFVFKIGAGTDVTKGKIVSPAHHFCEPLLGNANQNSIFLVKGFKSPFAKDGDSGSLVFSRPKDGNQTYINIVGMVFGIDANLTEEEYESTQTESEVLYSREAGHSKESEQDEEKSSSTLEKKKMIEENNKSAQSKVIYSREASEEPGQDVDTSSSSLDKEKEYITMCFPIRPALNLFESETNQSYRFKDDLPM